MTLLKRPLIKGVIAVAGIYVTLHILSNNLHLLEFSDHVKQITWTVFLIAGTILLYMYVGEWAKRKSTQPGQVILTNEQNKNIHIIEYGSNRIGDIDKLLFEQHGEKIWLHFPPHTARYVLQVAIIKERVQADYLVTPKKAADNIPMYDLVNVRSEGRSFSIKDIPPPPPASGQTIELTGTIVQYKKDESGNISGFVIHDYIIEIPKHMEQNIVPMLQHAGTIIVKGYERNKDDGFVNTTGFKLIKPYAITIDKTNYLL